MSLPVSDADMRDILALLTNQKGLDGTGYFDTLMRASDAHIRAEFGAGRIAPAEYAKAYVEMLSANLQGAISYLTTAPTSLYQTKLAEKQLEIAQADLDIRLKELEIKEQELAQAEKELELLEERRKKLIAETDNINQQTANMAEQLKALEFETVSAEHKAKAMEYRVDAEYAVTHNTLPDGSPIGGSLGMDIEIKEAQRDSFKAKDAYQMISALLSSNTAQITTLDEVAIAPTYTTKNGMDGQLSAYFDMIGLNIDTP